MRNKNNMHINAAYECLKYGFKIAHKSMTTEEYLEVRDGVIKDIRNEVVDMDSMYIGKEQYDFGWYEHKEAMYKLSHLIAELQRIKDIHGDINVFVQGGDYGEDQNTIQGMSVESEHFDYNGKPCVVLNN